MRHLTVWIPALVFSVLAMPPALGLAETSNEEVATELKEMKKALQAQNDLIQKQQNRINELERKVSTTVRAESFDSAGPPTFPIVLSLPTACLPVRQGQAGLSKDEGDRPAQDRSVKALGLPGQIGAVLPEIGVVGEIVATASENKSDTEGNNRISAREIELVLGNYVDPYSRYDATISFSDFEEAGVEEAYLTRWGLPWDMKARLGRFFPRIGKAAAMHRDSLDSVDEPLVVQKFFGAEGLKRSGVDFTRPVEGPFGLVFEPSVGMLEGGVGEGGRSFGSTRRRPTFYSHLKTFKELNDASNAELGLTHMVGSSDADPRFEVNVLGADATFLYYPTPFNKLKLQSEVYVQSRAEAFSINGTTGATTQFDRRPWGAYALADYRFAPRWSVGARADQVRVVDAVAARHQDQGLSAWLTFYQSEFARWRLQYRHQERAREKKSEDAVFLQGTFAIGTHKHSLQ